MESMQHEPTPAPNGDDPTTVRKARPTKQPRSYEPSVRQLNEMSVRKHYLAYRDIAWDAPENRIEAHDPRFALRLDTPLGAHAWYLALSESQRAALGLDMMCQVLKYGVGFESVLSRGLIEFALTRPNRDATYRYALHELIEESQHSLMFQELINRSGTDPAFVTGIDAFIDRRIARMGAHFPEMFFFSVLAGEIFIDFDNRQTLRRPDLHPLLKRVAHIHITEEARHVRFAELYLHEHVPQLSRWKRGFIELVLPLVLRDSARMMLTPSKRVSEKHRIPRAVLRDCYGQGSRYREEVETLAQPVFALLGERYAAKARVFAPY